MKSPAQSFLTPEERQQITRCVQQAEKLTSGEIVPMVVSASHDYPMAAVTGATFIALPLSLLATRFITIYFWLIPDNLWLFLGSFILFFLSAHQLLQRVPWLKRAFLSESSINEEVREAASIAFFNENLYRTKAENGILLFISVFERRVWILGDRGINEKISPERWQEIVDLVTDGIKNNRQCEAICDAINRVAEMLREFFPIEEDDKNELHNLIIK